MTAGPQCEALAATASGFFLGSGSPTNAPHTFNNTFNSTGLFLYHCSVHCSLGMTGEIMGARSAVYSASPSSLMDHSAVLPSNATSNVTSVNATDTTLPVATLLGTQPVGQQQQQSSAFEVGVCLCLLGLMLLQFVS